MTCAWHHGLWLQQLIIRCGAARLLIDGVLVTRDDAKETVETSLSPFFCLSCQMVISLVLLVWSSRACATSALQPHVCAFVTGLKFRFFFWALLITCDHQLVVSLWARVVKLSPLSLIGPTKCRCLFVAHRRLCPTQVRTGDWPKTPPPTSPQSVVSNKLQMLMLHFLSILFLIYYYQSIIIILLWRSCFIVVRKPFKFAYLL